MDEPEPPDLDPDALQERLAASGLTTGFTQQSWHYLGRFSNDVWRLDLDGAPTLIAKQPYRPPRADDHPDVERLFYRTIAELAAPTENPLPIPRYLGELQGTLLLEYQPLQPFSFATGASGQHAQRAVAALADWHIAWWGQAPKADWLPRLDDPAQLARTQHSYDAAWRAHGERLLASAPEFRELGDALVGRLATTLGALAEPATLIHGDAHAENLPLTEDGHALLLDWQDPRIGNPGYDLAVFMTMSFRQADRAAREAELIEQYFARLQSAGCRWQDPWRGYRLGLLRRAARIVELADVDFPSLPWVFRRSAMAALAHDAGDLIR